MLDIVIKAEKRAELGSSAVKKLRAEGKVPAVLYGKELDSIHLTLNESEMNKFIAVRGTGAKLKLSFDNREEMAIIKHVQREVLKSTIVHLELQHLSAGTKIKLALPVHFVGAEQAGKNQILQKVVHELDIEALPKDLIDFINVDVSNLELGDSLTLADLPKADYPGIEFLGDETLTLATVTEVPVFVEPTEGEEESEEATEIAEEGKDIEE